MDDIKDVLADVKNEGEKDPFEALEKETPSESLPEKEPEEKSEKEVPEKEEPFHKHPRWLERENELKELRERDKQTAQELADLKEFREKTEQRFSSTDVPEWFKTLYGDNKEAYTLYQKHHEQEVQQIESGILARQQAYAQQQQAEQSKWNTWVDNEIVRLKDEGKEFDKNSLIKIMLDYRPTDQNNNFDFNKGYEIYSMLNKKTEKVDAKKEIADKANSSSRGEKPKKDYMTNNDLRSKSWGAL